MKKKSTLLGGAHKLRLQDEVGRWSKNIVNVYTIEIDVNTGG